MGFGRFFWTDQAEPAIAVGRVAKLFQRRNVGKRQRAFGSRRRQCPELPGIDERLGLLTRHHGVGQAAGKHFRRHLGGCRERNGDRLEARELREQRASDLDRAALVSVRDLVGIFLGVIDEILDRLHRQVRVHDQDHRRNRQARDRRDVVDRIVRQLIERRQHRLAARQHEQAVAVGALLHECTERHEPLGTGPVLDHEGLAERVRENLGRDARRGVGGTPSASANGHLHGSRWIAGVLATRLRLAQQQSASQASEQRTSMDGHAQFPSLRWDQSHCQHYSASARCYGFSTARHDIAWPPLHADFFAVLTGN